MSSTEARQFHAVIIGGGPVGLCLAHALSLAGIDYVLLERRDKVVEESGFGLALWPHSVRILDQLGLLEEGQKMSLTMKD
jgi:2-polyprenyl-6-methoxyphenol hydroxylase-like FAD-dependent oxidoreductase